MNTHEELLKQDIRNLKSMLTDAGMHGCGTVDADYMRGLLEAIISATIIGGNDND